MISLLLNYLHNYIWEIKLVSFYYTSYKGKCLSMIWIVLITSLTTNKNDKIYDFQKLIS